MSIATATLTRQDLFARVATAAPGDRIVYHIGDMIVDRVRGSNFMTVHSTAQAAWELMMGGKVHLAQRRLYGDNLLRGDFEYLAIKKPLPYKAIEWTGSYDPNRASHNVPSKKAAPGTHSVGHPVEGKRTHSQPPHGATGRLCDAATV